MRFDFVSSRFGISSLSLVVTRWFFHPHADPKSLGQGLDQAEARRGQEDAESCRGQVHRTSAATSGRGRRLLGDATAERSAQNSGREEGNQGSFSQYETGRINCLAGSKVEKPSQARLLLVV